MTPSGWHDDAQSRDAGHDEMQIAVFDYLGGQANKGLCGLESSVGFEVPFIHRGQIIAWADIAQDLRNKGDDSPQYLFIWEIKPKIYSVGAVVRQCIALLRAARVACTDRNGNLRTEIKVFPVVRADDPKLAMLRHVFHAQAWDGERLS